MQDSVAMNFLKHTKPTASLNAKDYDAIYIVGGKGPMFDLVVDPSLQDLILEMNTKKSTIAAVCHGTIAFANIKKDTQYLIDGRSLTGFATKKKPCSERQLQSFHFSWKIDYSSGRQTIKRVKLCYPS